MTEPIKLPPLPEHDHFYEDGHDEYGYVTFGSAHSDAQLKAYATAAVEADRAALQSQDREDAERLRLRIETIRVLIPSTPSDEELDIAINHARRVEEEAK